MAEANVITVSGLTKYIRSVLERDANLSGFTVSGEISNFTLHRTGHLYFALKDENAVINAVMFRSDAARLGFKPENGMKVIARGRITVFEPAGRYQVVVNSMEVDGVGDLYVAYERLKLKLQKEGLFDAAHKKPIPKIPRSIGVITSPTGAAVRDIINVTGRRFPFAHIYVYPSLVQGDGAAAQLISALEYFERTRLADVVIIGRGGGSIEDLWAFNDEQLAHTIYNMTVPVISAVGHEIDFTICDFVADVRAPTPSAAAELAVPDTAELLAKFDNVNKRLSVMIDRVIKQGTERLNSVTNSRIFTDADYFTEKNRLLLDHAYERLCTSVNVPLIKCETEFGRLSATLDAMSPLKIMSRGYAVPTDKSGRVIKSVGELNRGDALSLRMNGGRAECLVNNIIEE